MAGGVTPSEDFNRQLIRTVQQVARSGRLPVQTRNRWHKKGGGGSETEVAWGYIQDADCDNSTIDIQVDLDTTNCGVLSDATNDTTITAHDTPLVVLRGYTDSDLPGLYAKAIYAWDRDTCQGKWRIDEIEIPPGCTVAIENVE